MDQPPLQRLGDFERLRELGRGGLGVVFEARQLSLNRKTLEKNLVHFVSVPSRRSDGLDKRQKTRECATAARR